MPGYKTHLVGGLLAYLIVMSFHGFNVSINTFVEWLVFAMLGSLFPDVDTHSNARWLFFRLVTFLAIFLAISQRWRSLVALYTVSFVPLIARHRGIFHNLFFILMGMFILLIVCNMYWPQVLNLVFFDVVFFVVGCVSHLILDKFIKQ